MAARLKMAAINNLQQFGLLQGFRPITYDVVKICKMYIWIYDLPYVIKYK